MFWPEPGLENALARALKSKSRGVEVSVGPRLHLYYGDGKGKTTAALGLAARALGAGKKVAIVQFDKDGTNCSERKALEAQPGLTFQSFGLNRVLGPDAFRFKNEPGDYEQARNALTKAKEWIGSGDVFLLVLDEILAAVSSELLPREDVNALLDLYDKRRRCELVLTGREVWPELVARADLVTEMKKVRHYFDRKEPPREGIEY